MDEAHNLVHPTKEMAMYKTKFEKLKKWITTAENNVFVAFTATPFTEKPSEGEKLLEIVKGPFANKNDEGFISYFYTMPPVLYPTIYPDCPKVYFNTSSSALHPALRSIKIKVFLGSLRMC